MEFLAKLLGAGKTSAASAADAASESPLSERSFSPVQVGEQSKEFRTAGVASRIDKYKSAPAVSPSGIDFEKESKIAEAAEFIAGLRNVAGKNPRELADDLISVVSGLENEEIEQALKASFLFGEANPDEAEMQFLKRKISEFSQVINIFDQYIQDYIKENPEKESLYGLLDIKVIFESAVESALQEAVTNEYVASESYQNVAWGTGNNYKLPLPELKFLDLNDSKAPKSKKQMVEHALAAVQQDSTFKLQTGVDEASQGRRVIDMSGELNMCGYRSILSQIDSMCIGGALSLGGREAMSLDTLEKVAWLRLAIAVGHINADEGIQAPTKLNLVEEVQKLGRKGRGPAYNESVCGMLETEDVRYIAQAIDRPIVVISDRYILDEAVGASLEINSHDGSATAYYNALLEDDQKPKDAYNSDAAAVFTSAEKQRALVDALGDPSAVVLFHVGGNHFMSVQRN